MSVYYEKIIMKSLNVCYKEDVENNTNDEEEDDDGEGSSDPRNVRKLKGCVSQYFNKLLNKYRCNIKDNMIQNKRCVLANVCTNSPPDWEQDQTQKKLKGKNPCYTFWVAKKDENDGRVSDTAGSKKRNLPISWSWVRQHST
jgi:hypothetical protein